MMQDSDIKETLLSERGAKEGSLGDIDRLEVLLDTAHKENNQLKTRLVSKDKEIDQLIQSEAALKEELNGLKNGVFYKLYMLQKKILFPQGSRRNLIIKLIFRCLRHPLRLLKSLSPHNIKVFFKRLKNKDLEHLSARIGMFIGESDPSLSGLEIFEYDENNIPLIEFDATDEPLVTIVMPVYNQWSYTYNSLRAIKEFTADIPFELIIGDDVSTDETASISAYIKNIRVIRNSRNIGFLQNCNNAASFAKGKYIYFINNDTQVQKDWLKPLVRLMEDDESVGMCGSKLVYPDGRLQEAGGIFWSDGSAWNYGRFEDAGRPKFNYVKNVDYISGAAIMIRKKLWDEIGGFDPRYEPAYCEDSDLAFEVRKRGLRVVYHPKSVVVHFEGITNGTDTSGGIKSYQIENMKKFYEKWKDVLQAEHFINGENVFWARDRSRGKKCVVVIDHYVPQYDKDAGSKNTYLFLRQLVKEGYHTIFIGDNFTRQEPYTSELQRLGIEVIYGTDYMNSIKSYFAKNAAFIDTVVLNRPHIGLKYIDTLSRCGIGNIVFHGHDLHYLREKAQYETTGDKSYLKSAEKMKRIEFSIFEKSDAIMTVSSKEKEIIRAEFPNKKIEIVPVFFYERFEDIGKLNISDTKDLLFVGGFGHPPNADAVLYFANEIFPQIKGLDAKLIVVGSNPPEEIKKLDGEDIIIKGFVSDEELEQLYRDARVVVIPLRFGAGVKGKTIEAMHSLTPIVSTSFGIEGLADIETCVNAMDDAKSFADEVRRLYSSNETILQTICKYDAYVREYFSEERARTGVLNLVNR